MLCLILQIGDARFALEAGLVLRVLPLLRVRPLPQAAPGVAGLMIYHGGPVPVIDLGQITFGQPAPVRLSTRIVLVNQPFGEGAMRAAGLTSPVGLIVERATETRRFTPADFFVTPVAPLDGVGAEAIATDAQGFIQKLDLAQLLRRFVHPLGAGRGLENPLWASAPSKSF